MLHMQVKLDQARLTLLHPWATLTELYMTEFDSGNRRLDIRVTVSTFNDKDRSQRFPGLPPRYEPVTPWIPQLDTYYAAVPTCRCSSCLFLT
jgi:hypothetical protein